MSEEEKKAMEFLRLNSIGEYKRNENGSITHMIAVEDFKKILRLIERQQNEIKQLKQENIDLLEQLKVVE